MMTNRSIYVKNNDRLTSADEREATINEGWWA